MKNPYASTGIPKTFSKPPTLAEIKRAARKTRHEHYVMFDNANHDLQRKINELLSEDKDKE